MFEQYGEESVGDPDIIRLPWGACVDQDHEATLPDLFLETVVLTVTDLMQKSYHLMWRVWKVGQEVLIEKRR